MRSCFMLIRPGKCHPLSEVALVVPASPSSPLVLPEAEAAAPVSSWAAQIPLPASAGARLQAAIRVAVAPAVVYLLVVRLQRHAELSEWHGRAPLAWVTWQDVMEQHYYHFRIVIPANVLRFSRRFNDAGAYRVLYHGTGEEEACAILSSGRLLPSVHGMMGPAVYLGSFWKAVRFAHFYSDWGRGIRPSSAVVRLLVDTGPRVGVLKYTPPFLLPPCQCATCSDGTVPHALRRLVDHDGVWRRQYSALLIPPGTWAPGKWLVKNAEWALPSTARQWVLDARVLSQDTRKEPYDPRDRSHFVLLTSVGEGRQDLGSAVAASDPESAASCPESAAAPEAAGPPVSTVRTAPHRERRR